MNKLLYRVFGYMLGAIFVSLIFVSSIHSDILNNGKFLNIQVLNSEELGIFYRAINEYTDIRAFTENKMHYEVMKIDVEVVRESDGLEMTSIVGIYDDRDKWAVGSKEGMDLTASKEYLRKNASPIIRVLFPPELPNDYFILPTMTKDGREVNFVIEWSAESFKVLDDYAEITHKIQMGSILIALLVTFIPVTVSLGFGYLRPLRRLQNAANTIAAGELDFNIKSQGLDEIRALSKSFEHMRYELEESNKREQVLKEGHRQLITNMSHDLKTPITSIKGYVEGLIDGKANNSERMERYLKTIQSKTLYLDAMINDLFEFSQLDLGEYKLDLKVWNSVEVVNLLTEPIQLGIEDAGWTFEQKGTVPNTYLYIDMVRIAQVIENIVQNSLKYGEENGTVTIESYIKNHHFALKLCDTGIGIAEESLPYVFEAFYREDSSRSHQVGGSGLGLAICKKIVELHGGHIEVQSTYGIGTCMSIFLPLKPI